MPVDPNRWTTVLLSVLAMYPDDVVGEREAVLHFADIHSLLTSHQNGDT